jgi:hypothetical protein
MASFVNLAPSELDSYPRDILKEGVMESRIPIQKQYYSRFFKDASISESSDSPSPNS